MGWGLGDGVPCPANVLVDLRFRVATLGLPMPAEKLLILLPFFQTTADGDGNPSLSFFLYCFSILGGQNSAFVGAGGEMCNTTIANVYSGFVNSDQMGINGQFRMNEV